MPKGTIKWFNEGKGMGFIVPEEGGADVFLHVTSVEKSGLSSSDLVDERAVWYELMEDRKGKMAAGTLRLLDR